ncbi:hypothetical protein EB796_014282 [Bugula neritina]|uniref:Uncharacterized protein n=1 Tax=Bugula neritina TaxID=10212 RepID=A0A7J7JMZ2_BUGNE|nr:hypothetical protein EB796_014282 [Bugula neritina]
MSKEQPMKYSKQRENNSALWENLSRQDQQTPTAGQSLSLPHAYLVLLEEEGNGGQGQQRNVKVNWKKVVLGHDLSFSNMAVGLSKLLD